MDNRTPDNVSALSEFTDRASLKINTSIPGTIESFDPSTQTAIVIPSVKMRIIIDGEENFIDYPPIINVPVCFYSVSVKGFCITLPINKGDPCWLSFAQRSIDNWHERGGVQPPEEGISSRHHDLTDAVAIMAPVPLAEVFSNLELNGLEIRNRAKTSRVTIKDDKIEIHVGTTLIIANSDGSFSINASLLSTIATGQSIIKMEPNGTITITAPVVLNINSPLVNMSGNLSVAGGIASLGTYGVSGGKIETPGEIEANGDIISNSNVKDSTRTMQGDRDIYNDHDHDENGDGGGTTNPPNQGQ